MNKAVSIITRNNFPVVAIGTEEYVTPLVQSLNWKQKYNSYNTYVVDIMSMREADKFLNLTDSSVKERWNTLDELNLIEKVGLKLYKESLNPDNEFYTDEDLIFSLIKIRKELYDEYEDSDYDPDEIANEMMKRFNWEYINQMNKKEFEKNEYR